MEEVKKRHKERGVKVTINDENETLQLPFFKMGGKFDLIHGHFK